MNPKQLLKLLNENRSLILRNNYHAYEHLQMMNKDYAHIKDEEVILNMELNNHSAEIQFHSQYEKTIQSLLKNIDKYENSVYQIPVIRHYWLLGKCYANTGEFQKAEDCLLTAFKKIKSDEREYKLLKVDLLHILAMNEQIAQKGPEKSIQYLTEAIQLLTHEDSIHKANCLMALGNVYINADMVEPALKNYNAAAITFEHHFDLSNMGNVYSNIGTCYLKMEDFPKAEKYLEKSLELRLKVGSPEHLSISYYNLALVYKEQNKLDLAQDLLLKCKGILESTDSKPFIKDTEDELAKVALLKTKQEIKV